MEALLCRNLGFGRLPGSLGSQIHDFAAVVGSAIHADAVALVQSLAILAFRKAHDRETVMRASVAGMRPGAPHSIYHVRHYYTSLSFAQRYRISA